MRILAFLGLALIFSINSCFVMWTPYFVRFVISKSLLRVNLFLFLKFLSQLSEQKNSFRLQNLVGEILPMPVSDGLISSEQNSHLIVLNPIHAAKMGF